ncbi:MAG TPA: radical SAM protein [Kofleriaceae bacterium]|nr:radical SAM protein [Kofleriaceae bacterium]
MKDRSTSNPPNRFHATTVAYDEGDGPPPAQVTLLEDHSRSILSHNDSPDLGFRWSANPYRGCLHACGYCVSPDTPILLADGRTRAIADLKVGDEVYGTRFDGSRRRHVRTRVLDHWPTVKVGYRIELSDGTSLVASGDHRFLSSRGWKYVIGSEQGGRRRPHLTTSSSLLGTGRFATAPDESDDYRRGYLCGLIRGDGHADRFPQQVRLALGDLEAVHRAKRYVARMQLAVSEYALRVARPHDKPVPSLASSSRATFDRVAASWRFPCDATLDWHKGFLAGMFDAKGSHGAQIVRIANTSPEIIEQVVRSARRLAFDVIVETREPGPVMNVRVRGGLSERLRFFHTTNPAITHKWDLEGTAIDSTLERRVVSITRLGRRTLCDITTGTGDFIANGIISHNCYARPTHEYLDLGAGSDFDTKIVVKPHAAELLRETFDKPSWRGELVMFSGVTDCYQAIERELQLTRRMLEVCLDYRNPVAIITKSALVERDVELVAELAREAGAHLSVSLAWIDGELARAIEPWAAAPARRLRVIETFAKAGVPVGVMCAPIIPGLNDDQLIRLLEAARDAGATSAGWTLLRLPGAVKQVFEERLRAALPLAADKIMHRIRETRGGDKLYDPRFLVRGRGEGVYAETIAAVFASTVKRLGLGDRDAEREMPSRFRRPRGQLSLF